jgi:Fe-S oxidoreductase
VRSTLKSKQSEINHLKELWERDQNQIAQLKAELKKKDEELFRHRYIAVNSWIESVSKLNNTIAQAIGEGLEQRKI